MGSYHVALAAYTFIATQRIATVKLKPTEELITLFFPRSLNSSARQKKLIKPNLLVWLDLLKCKVQGIEPPSVKAVQGIEPPSGQDSFFKTCRHLLSIQHFISAKSIIRLLYKLALMIATVLVPTPSQNANIIKSKTW